MKKLSGIKKIIIFAIVAVVLVVAGLMVYKATRGNNVLIITLDTTRADHLGCYGYEKAETPVLDRVAERGTRFDRAFSNVPLTLPAHSSIMTGLYPPEHGCRVNGMHKLGKNFPTMAEMFKDHGYATSAFVAAFVLDKMFGLGRGFDTYDDHEVPDSDDPYDNNKMYKYRRADEVVASTIKWMQKKRLKPFFTWVHLYDPHRPYYYKRDPYDKEIRFMDSQIGNLLGYLKKTKQLDKTMIVIVGDHGECLGEHGEDEHGLLLYNAAMHVPLIMKLPDVIPANEVVEDIVSHVDLFPTIADLMGWELPEKISGKSFAGFFRGESVDPIEVYMETEFPLTEYGWSPIKAIVSQDMKYIEAPKPELYDMMEDFAETNNVVNVKTNEANDMIAGLEDLEGVMTIIELQDIKLDAKAQEALESLGYLGGSGGGDEDVVRDTLRDPKDAIRLRSDFIKAMGLEKMKKFDEAEEAFRKIIKESPETFTFQYKLATMLYRIGKYAAACEQYEVVAKKYPERYKTHYTFGTSLIRLGRFDQAVDELKLALKIDNRQLPAYNNLGIALMKSGELYESLEIFNKSLALKPNQKDVHNNLGSAYLAMKKIDEAEAEFRKAVQLDANYVDAQYNLGLVLLGKRKFKEAEQQFIATLKLNPNHPTARMKLYASRNNGKLPARKIMRDKDGNSIRVPQGQRQGRVPVKGKDGKVYMVNMAGVTNAPVASVKKAEVKPAPVAPVKKAEVKPVVVDTKKDQ